MKTKKLKTEKKDNPTFAFMPAMVLNHLEEAKPTEPAAIVISNEPVIEKVTITADPEIPNLDSLPDNFAEPIIAPAAKIKKKENRKSFKTVNKTDLESPTDETEEENTITRFLKKSNTNLYQFLNQFK